jgi:hypothetical protein
MDGVDTMRRWSRYGERYRSIGEEDDLRPRRSLKIRLAIPTGGQAADAQWSGDRDVKAKTIYGDEQEVLELLGASTSYVERTNLTSRHMNGRLVRKTLGYSKELKMLRASSIWEDAVYNLGRALKTLRVESSEEAASRRWIGRSPAMAAGLTDHIWEIEELLSTLPLPSTNS